MKTAAVARGAPVPRAAAAVTGRNAPTTTAADPPPRSVAAGPVFSPLTRNALRTDPRFADPHHRRRGDPRNTGPPATPGGAPPTGRRVRHDLQPRRHAAAHRQ